MTNRKQKTLPTRDRLVLAAAEVFAEKGYHDSTVAEICVRAKANIAALNYHLGDKAAAYREAYKSAFADSLSRHPIDLDCTTAPAQRLESHVASLLCRMKDNGTLPPFERIRNWELTRPTGLVDDVDKDVRGKSREHMLHCLRELLADDISEHDLLASEALIMGMVRIVLPFNWRDIPHQAKRKIAPELADRFARRIVGVVLGGIDFSTTYRSMRDE